MKPLLARTTALLLIAVISTPELWATCGGGGGGGMGGMSGGAGFPGAAEQVYNVPWRLRTPEAPPVTMADAPAMSMPVLPTHPPRRDRSIHDPWYRSALKLPLELMLSHLGRPREQRLIA